MKIMNRYILSAGAVIIAVALAVSAYAGDVKAEVYVNGVVISRNDVDRALENKIRSTTFHRNVPDEKMQKIRETVVEELIDRELVYQDSVGSVTVSGEEIAAEMKKLKDRFPSEEAFRNALEKASVDEEQLKKGIERELAIRKNREAKIFRKASVRNDEARAYYEKNRMKYNEPEKLKLREIFLSVPSTATGDERAAVRERAEGLLKRLKEGENFGLLAWDNSEDKYKYTSGDVGYVHKGMLSSEAEEAVWKLDVGMTTDVVETIYGYYLFFLEERVPSRELSFNDVSKRIIDDLRKEKEEDVEKNYIRALRDKAEIKRVSE